MKIKLTIVVILVISLGLSACGPGQVFGPTLTLTPTSTTIPTNTSTPTATSTPTITPTLTPTPVLPALAQTPIPIEPQLITSDSAPLLREIGIVGFGTPAAVAWSPNSKYLAVATRVGVVLYSPPDLTRTFFWYLDQFTIAVAFDQTGQILAAGTDSGIHLLDTATFKEQSFSPMLMNNLRDIKLGPDDRLYAFNEDGILNIFNSKTGSLLKSLDLKIGENLALSPDGRYLALSGNAYIKIIDLETYEITQIEDWAEYYTSVSFSPNGKLLAAISPAGVVEVHIWNFSTRSLVTKLYNGRQGGDDSHINGIAFYPDGSFVAMVCGDPNYHESLCLASIYLSVISKQYEIAKSSVDTSYNLAGSAFSPDGKLLAIISDSTVTLWDAKTLTKIGTLNGLSGDIRHIVLTGQNQGILAYRSHASVELWDIHTQSLINTIDGFSFSNGLAADGNGMLYVGSGNSIQIYSTSDGKKMSIIPAHDDLVTDIAVNKDGSVLASTSLDGKVKVFDPISGHLIRNFKMSPEIAFGVALSPDGKQVVGGGGNGNPNPTLWNIQTGEVILRINNFYAYKITFSPDGEYIAGVGGNGHVQVWDANSGSLVQEFTDLLSEAGYGGIAFSPDGRIVAASGAGENYTAMVALWDVATGKLLTKFRSSCRFQTPALLFSSDGKRLYAGGRDGVVRVYGVLPSSFSTTPVNGLAWEFESAGNTEGWEALNQITNLQVSQGNLTGKSTGDDPYMSSPKFVIAAKTFPIINIRMKVSSGYYAQLYFMTPSDSWFSESKSLRFAIDGDGEFHTYTLEMDKLSDWKGTITQIRLDPFENPSSFDIDYIRIIGR